MSTTEKQEQDIREILISAAMVMRRHSEEQTGLAECFERLADIISPEDEK